MTKLIAKLKTKMPKTLFAPQPSEVPVKSLKNMGELNKSTEFTYASPIFAMK